MYYARETSIAFANSKKRMSDKLIKSLNVIHDWMEKYSPLTDITRIISKESVKLPSITFSKDRRYRYPIRNIVRILAKLGDEGLKRKISSLYFHSMIIGCDTFEGKLQLELEDNTCLEVNYKWQWTAFSDGGIHYDKFTRFEVANFVLVKK